MVKKPEIQDIYSLSPMQEGILFHAMLDSKSTAYFEQIEFDIAGEVDVELVEESMNAVIARHDVFRTVFVTDKVKQPRQVVLKERPITVHYEDWVALSQDEQQEKLCQFRAADMAKGFDLVKDPLMRLTVFKLAATSYRWIWSHHHIVMDGWCVSIVMKQFMEYYQLKKQGLLVPRYKAVPYSSYIAWLGEQDKEEALSYWGRTLFGYEQGTSLPKVAQIGTAGGYRQQTVSCSLSEATTASLHRLANASQATMSTVVQCIWGVLLQKYNGTADAVFGAVVSGRPSSIAGIENMVGLFINTIPVRIKAEGDHFAELVRRVQESTLEAEAYSFVPLYDIQNQTELRQNLIDHVLVFENFPVQQELEGSSEEIGSDFQICGFHAYEQTNYDFDITVAPGEGLTFQFSFNANKYDPLYIEQVAMHVEHIANQVAANPNVAVAAIELVTVEEKTRLIEAYNETDAELPTQPVHEWFETQVANGPERTAVRYNGKDICYAELNARANQLARYLLAQGSEREELIAILMDRSPEMLVAIVAIWKAGGAYVPVDPGYPADRQRTILRESGVRFIIGDAAGVSGLEWGTDESSARVILLDQEAEAIAQQSADNLDLPVQLSQLAYVIYTSGSTGMPKGTMIEHAGMLNHILAEIEEMQITADTVLAQNASHCFDISVWQFVAALTVGGVTAIYPNELVLEPVLFTAQIIRDQVSILEVVPSYLSVMMDYMEAAGVRPTALHYLMITGETVKPAMVRRWFEICPDIRMVNAYGPAEAADDISHYVMDKPLESDPVPIGKPIRNMRIYIVDDQLQLCPIGMVGEICVSGVGVGRGYLRDPERTASVFLEDPFREKRGVRMYRTGDLGRRLPDGNIEFFGRKDYQVKIRGFRIELGEIEARLAEYERVKEAVVLDVEDEQGMKQLAAYVTVAGEGKPEAEELKGYLARQLPAYMVPASVQVLDELPLTPNGKIDRKALPKPELGFGSMAAGGAPQTETERELASIWQEVLGVVEVGRELSFFEAGGHSLKAMTLVSRIHKELDVEMPLREVFARPQLHRQAAYIEQAARETYSHIPQAPKRPYYPLSFAQRRMYLLQRINPEQTSYNMPAIATVTGTLDTQKVKRVFRQIVERHEALRTSFHTVDKEPVQRIHSSVDLDMKLLVLPDGLSAEEEQVKVDAIIETFIKPFDLSKAPIMRTGWIQCAPDRYILLADFHHIIADGVSMNVLVDEFNRLYNDEVLPPLAIQYKDYAVWQQEPRQRERMLEQETYWLSALGGELPDLQLPTDFPRPAVKSFEGATLHFRLPRDTTFRLGELVLKQQSTLFMLLLSAYQVLLSKCSGQEDIITGVPTAGRPLAEMERVFGMFINTLALRSHLSAGQRFSELAKQVKNQALSAFENQDYPFEELVERLRVKRDLSRNPIFDTMFVMQNIDQTESYDYGLVFQPYVLEYRLAKFDLMLTAVEDDQDGSIGFSLEYSTRLFRRETVERIAGYYLQILETVAANPDVLLQDMVVLSAEEEHNLLFGWNQTEAAYPKEKTIHEIFEDQTEVWPERTALVYEGRKLTYRELNRQANAIAHRLRTNGVGRGSIVAVMMNRSLGMVTALLAVLKAGGTYLPIDPSYPSERIQFMLEDSGTAWLLTDGSASTPKSFSGQVVILDDTYLRTDSVLDNVDPGPGIEDETEDLIYSNLEPLTEANDLAYIIYTSGTTGKPKGAMLEHKNVVRLLHNDRNLFDFNEKDVWTMFHSYCFDFSVWEMYGALLYGGTLVVVPKETAMNPKAFLQLLDEERVTILNQTPTAFYQLLQEEARQSQQLLALRYVIFGGEALNPLLLGPFHARYPQTRLINMYGITETTVHVTYKEITEVEIAANSGSIGLPIPTLTAYVLDSQMKPVPVGVIGELYVGGEGVGRGYLNRPELTADRFLNSPFVSGERLYKSGDLARRLADGELLYMGRIDHQVKIRGHRIELPEVEAALLRQGEVQEVVVLAREDGNGQAYLCAYYTGMDQDEVVSPTKLRSYMKSVIPDYMVPSYFVRLDAIPLTGNGKVDRNALPEPHEHLQTEAVYAPPRNEIEAALAVIWQDVLGVSRAGIDDHFFESGGHSLKVMSFCNEVSRVLGMTLPLQEVFIRPTIRELAAYISADKAWQYGQFEQLIMLKKGKDNSRHIFMIHGGSGDVTAYVQLVNLLPDDTNYWGIQFPTWEEVGPKYLTIEELASKYAEFMTSIQPHGPYTIVGMSLGGVIGYEIVRQLEERGEKINRLVLIDSHAPALTPLKKNIHTLFSLETELELAADFIGQLSESGISLDIDACSAAQTIEEVWTRVAYMIEKHNQKDELLERIKQVADEDLRRSIPHFDQLSFSGIMPYVHLLRSLTAAFTRYKLQPLQACTPNLIIAAATTDLDVYSWELAGRQQIIISHVEGDHYSIFAAPYVAGLASCINKILEQRMVQGQPV